MTDDRASATTAFPTRRELRLAERARLASEAGLAPSPAAADARALVESAGIVESAAVVESTASTAGTAEDAASAPAAVPTIASVSDEVARAEKTSGRTTASARFAGPRATFARRWVPRLAVLGSLALATTAIPLSGATSPTTAETSASFAAASALDVLAAEQVDGTDAYDSSAPLAADPLAAARALLTAARTEDRPVLQCGSAELEANGLVSAGATTEPVDVMLPLTTGSYRLTSQYGYRWGGMHEGMDMAAPAGTPIHAVASGEVTYVGYGLGGRSGMIIVLEHEVDGERFWTWYVHMYPDGIFVDVGDTVGAGEVIGEVGSYGNSTGPHLHLEVHVDSEFTTVDPAIWLDEHEAAPLTDENLACAAG